MNDTPTTAQNEAKLEWQTPILVDLGDGLVNVALNPGAGNDGIIEASVS
jgi:hypothetical protein